MRMIETPGGITTFLSMDECGVYENLLERTCKDELNEREIELLKSLVNKNVVKRVIENKKTYYERKKGSL